MYITTGEQDIFALDAKTGDIIWEYAIAMGPSRARQPGGEAPCVGLGEGHGVRRRSGRSAPFRDVLGEGTPASAQPAPTGGPSATQTGGGTPRGRQRPGGACDTDSFALNQKTGKVRWKVEVGRTSPGDRRKCMKAQPAITTAFSMPPCLAVTVVFEGESQRTTPRRARKSGASTPFRGPVSSGTTHGPATRVAGEAGGGAVWTQPAFDPDLGAALSKYWQPVGRAITNRRGGGDISLQGRSSPSTRRRAITAGTISSSGTTSGTSTLRRRSSSSIRSTAARCARPLPRTRNRGGCTSSTASLASRSSPSR